MQLSTSSVNDCEVRTEGSVTGPSLEFRDNYIQYAKHACQIHTYTYMLLTQVLPIKLHLSLRPLSNMEPDSSDPFAYEAFFRVPREVEQVREEAYRAAQEGRAADLAKCFETGFLLYTTRENRLVKHAFESQSIPTLEVLLEHGWDINMPEDWNHPPLLG